MFSTEENEKIGNHLLALINKKYNSQRRFAKAYIEADGRTATDEEIRKMANRVSQMIKGSKSIQAYDLPIFAKLLEVSYEEILSGGECLAPQHNRLTNYTVAFSTEQNLWDQYIHRDDKLILNTDEYGKTVIDYALQFKNFNFLKYLLEKNYIWFVGADPQNCFLNFGAGTSIKPRPADMVDFGLRYELAQNSQLRMQMITLAIEHNDIGLLKQLHAREIPSLYQTCFYSRKPIDCDKYYNEDLILHLSKASEQILDYFSEEFKITGNVRMSNMFLFPYMIDLLDLLIKENNIHLEKMLKASIKHNQNVYHQLKKLVHNAINGRLGFYRESFRCHQDKYIKSAKDEEDKYIESIKEGLTNDIMKDFYFYDNDHLVCFMDMMARDGIITNIIHTTSESKDSKISTLIQNLNDLYDKIRTKNFEYETRGTGS